MNILCLFINLFVSDKRQTAEPIRTKLFVATHITPGKVHDWS